MQKTTNMDYRLRATSLLGCPVVQNRAFMKHHVSPSIPRAPQVLLLIAGMLVTLLVVSTASAQSGGPGSVNPNDVNRVAKRLYCPVCPNTPLDVCETQACRDWRELIGQKLSAGESDEQIISYFLDQYGQRVLAEPTARGFNLLVWLIPLAALATGLAVLAAKLRAWSARPTVRMAVSPPTADEPPADYVARVEQELQLRSR